MCDSFVTSGDEHVSAAVERIQRRWRKYSAAVRQFEQAAAAAAPPRQQKDVCLSDTTSRQKKDGVSTAAALVQTRWREYRVEYVAAASEGLPLSPHHDHDHRHFDRLESDDIAAQRIQRRWKRYRSYVKAEHKERASSAARLIQRRWRERRSTGVNNFNFMSEERHEPRRQDVAAARIQRLWKRYRDAVQRYEEAASTVSEHGGAAAADVAAAAETIQRTWRQYMAARAVRSLTPPTRGVPAAPRPPSPVPGVASPLQPREAAATMIQYWWRLREQNAAPPEEGRPRVDATLHHVAAARLHEHARWRALIDQVRARDRNEAAQRLQDAWRTHRTIQKYNQQLAEGARHAAARCIQHAFRHRCQRAACCSRCNTRPLADARGRAAVDQSPRPVHYCVVCFDSEVQVALLPCGHAILCVECAKALHRCPACRALTAVRIRIFL